METLHLETEFEKYITQKLQNMNNSGNWRVSNNDTGFDPESALFIDDFLEFQERFDHDKFEKMKKKLGSNLELNIKKKLVNALEVDGTVETLRNGFPYAGFSTITCCADCPDDLSLRGAQEKYDANILRVMRQVHYQTAGDKSLDLVFFINGIPVATAELKTEMTQTVQDAIKEYQEERKAIEPKTGRKNYLLMFKRGAVVHFAISEEEIWMCTNLQSKGTPKFLPFNRGTLDGHAGNPPMQPNDEDYPTGYFWNDICQRDNWIRIFLHFIFTRKDRKEDATGRLKTVETQYFPRFHQWECVTKVINNVKHKGAGQSYLIEHSAGSGKTETLSWLADQLIRIRDLNGIRLFDSVIIISDRNSLDLNIKNTIGQVEKITGVVEMIGGSADHRKTGAKSKALKTALHDKRDIIVCTLQTFPYAFEAIANDEELVGSNFAVIIDEAHSSQSGIDAAKLKGALKLAHEAKKAAGDDGEVTDEDVINAYLRSEQNGRANPDNVSFFAFTATPKAETMTLFGTPSDQIDPKSGEPIRHSFHKYPMRQAIEEGYILDVLDGYMPYQTAYKIGQTNEQLSHKIVDSGRTKRNIAQWLSLHPTNVKEKAKFIVEHFIKNVAPLLDGEAKAMVVTDSRAAVVRYKYAISAYLDAHPEYNQNRVFKNLRFKVLGEPLVAFSGKLKGSKAIHSEDKNFETDEDYLQNPFVMIKKDYDYTEDNMNNISMSIESAFDQPEYRMMIVANKFQTGFDQPKLCAMYIDKPIHNDIEIVQTYSRLNRTHSGKDRVYIVDFVNDPDVVLKAFKKYDTGAEMNKAQDPNVVYEIKKNLDNAEVYTTMEYTTYKNIRYKAILKMNDPEKIAEYRKRMYASVSVPAERWENAYKAQHDAVITWHDSYLKAQEVDNQDVMLKAEAKMAEAEEAMGTLLAFRKNLRKYCKAYTYISQIIELDDPELEIFYGFCNLLMHRINGTDRNDVDINSLVMSNYRINKLDMPEKPQESSPLKPMRSGSSTGVSKQEELDEIIRQINLIWGDDVPPEDGATILNTIADIVSSDIISRIQIRNSTNSKEAIIQDGRLKRIVVLAIMHLKDPKIEKMLDKVLTDEQSIDAILPIIYDMVYKNTRIKIDQIMEAEKKSKK